jgi:hypothetical protein
MENSRYWKNRHKWNVKYLIKLEIKIALNLFTEFCDRFIIKSKIDIVFKWFYQFLYLNFLFRILYFIAFLETPFKQGIHWSMIQRIWIQKKKKVFNKIYSILRYCDEYIWCAFTLINSVLLIEYGFNSCTTKVLIDILSKLALNQLFWKISSHSVGIYRVRISWKILKTKSLFQF